MAERSQLRLQHLKGLMLIAKNELDAGHASEAGALIGQGKLEVYTPAATDFAGPTPPRSIPPAPR